MRQSSELTVSKLALSIIAFFGILATYLFAFKGATMEMSIGELWRMLGLRTIGIILVAVGVVVWLFGEIMAMIRRISGKDPDHASEHSSAQKSHIIDFDQDFSTSSIPKKVKTIFSKPMTIKFGGMRVVLDSDGGKAEIVSDSESSSKQVIDIDGSKQVIEFEGGKVVLDGDVQNITKEVKVYSVTHRSSNNDD